MRVDDDIGLHATLRERHVNHRPLLRADTFLTVPRRELVTDDGRTGDAQGDMDLLQLLVSRIATYVRACKRRVDLGVCRKRTEQTNSVDVGDLIALVLDELGATSGVVGIRSDGVTRVESRTDVRQTIEIQEFTA